MEVSEPEQNESPKAKDLANESAYWRGRFHGELRSQTFIGLVSPDWRCEQDHAIQERKGVGGRWLDMSCQAVKERCELAEEGRSYRLI